jgi:exodeoxyribonuclease V beta subunit
MKPLDSVFNMEWNPRVVVEASAGTGKTYTIVGLFIRLLIEKELDLDQILVMTFTNKATAELRGRILERLRECVTALESGNVSDDDFLKEFSKWVKNRDAKSVLDRLKRAIQNFDESRVFTIHGFCQKVLTEEALLAGVPFDMEIVQNDDLLLQASEDFWRMFMNQNSSCEAGRYYIQKLRKIAKSPSELIGREGIGDLFNQKTAVVEGEVMDDPISYLEDVSNLRKKVTEEWQRSKQEILPILENCDVKSYARYLDGRLKKLTDFIEDDYYESDTPDSLQYFTSDYLYDQDNVKSGGKPTKKHSFFEICTRYHELISDIDRVKTTLIREAFSEISKRREDLAVGSGAMTYDDLLLALHKALSDPERGPHLSEKLLKSYPYALVDEFQDTDSIQYSIFDSIYPKSAESSSLMMIGDPKQAIYAFRGADVYTYFQARKDGNPVFYSLNKNFRSSNNLIEAVNALFDDPARKPFIEEDIEFFKSEVGNRDIGLEYLVGDNPPVPFKVTLHPGLISNKGDCREFAYNQTVKQVAELLEDHSIRIRDSETKKMRSLEAGDIAILVSGHKDAVQIKKRLKDVGVDAVTYSQEKVFDTFEAKRLELLMQAVLEPLHQNSVNNLLLSGLMGTDAGRLFEMKEDDRLRQQVSDELTGLYEIWVKYGFQLMFRSFLYKKGRLDQLALMRSSERILTNLHQLADICSRIEQDSNMDPHTLYSWFVKEMNNPRKDDEQTLLLESDQNLVKISTIHGSKGLEYPVVICATLWEGRDYKKRDFYSYHKEGDDQLWINIDQHDTEERAVAENLFIRESVAEEVRKMYVAITRAKYECRIIWPTHTKSHISGLGASLIGRSAVIEHAGSNLKEDHNTLSEKMITDVIHSLGKNHPETIQVTVSDDASRYTKRVKWGRKLETELKAAQYQGRMELPVQHRVESFSSLAGHKSDPGEPDYDQITDWYVDARSGSSEEIKERTIFTFPKGALPGTAIHKLFEHDDFDFATADTTDHSVIIDEVLEGYGIKGDWTGVLQQMIRNVVLADYRSLELNRVERKDQLREMEFNFPISHPDSERLLDLIRNSRTSGKVSGSVRHYLTGFIDLIVRQNGKYYILDYKSNHLGDSPDDYSNELLVKEIRAADYDLQYHLYTVALIRFLKKRLPDFDYENNFGGVMYLFIRGMKAGSDNGIWYHKPEKSIIDQLDTMLDRDFSLLQASAGL